MTRRLIFVSAMTLAAAMLLMPASVAAVEGFHQRVIYNYCKGVDPHFKVKNIAAGWTKANKLTNETWVERRPANGSWKIVYTWPKSKYAFQINGDKHWLTSWRTWDGDNSYWYRIGFRLRAWHNRNLLSSTVLYSVKC
jgi:hypothetical protein